MGTTVNAIPIRLERGEGADVLIMVGYALGDLVKQGKVIADSRIDLTRSPIGIAVKSGAPKPDISSAEAVKRALLAAKSIAYSDSASGVYVSTEMFAKLGIADEMKDKARKIPATPVGEIVARGDAEIGFQQIAELLPVPGVDIVGPLPADLQNITVFSAGIATVSKEPEAGKALIKFLASPAARDTIVKSGMEPIAAGATN
jgi:molybdate transport system substrate-binding protein